MRKIKKTIAFFLSTILLTSTMVLPVGAVETNNVETNPTTVATKPVVEKTTKNVVDNKAKTKNKKVEKATEPTTEATVPLEPLPKEAFVAPSTSTKKKVTTGTKIEKLMTSATVAGGEISTDTSYETDLEDVWKNKYGDTWATQKVKMEYFTSGSSNSIYRYPNGTNWYSGKLARVTFTVGDTVAVWTVDKSSLSKGGTVDQGKGTLVVSRKTKSASAIPYFYYKAGGAKDKTKADIYVYAPWNGTCKKKGSSEYKHPFSHDQVTAIEIDHNVSEIGDYNFYGFAGGFKKLIMHKETKTIGKAAFRASSVSNIIWNGTKTINPEAFAYCGSLTTVNFTQNTDSNTNYNHTLKDPGAADNTSGYSVGCFQACSKLKTVKMGGITTIPKKCFYSCKSLDDITWGNVETVKSYAFSKAGENLTLQIKGTKLKTLEKESFRNCAYKVINFTGAANLKNSGVSAFCESDNLTTINIESGAGLTTISESSFYNCNSLKSLNIYSTKIKIIGANAFRDCDSFVNGRTTTSGSAELFGYSDTAVHPSRTASNYNVLELPCSITTIEQGAFRKCQTLRAITWDNISQVKLTTIKHNTFVDDYQLQFFALPDSVKTIEGTYDNNDTINTNTDYKKFGAFYISEEVCTSNNLNHPFYFAVGNKTNKLEVIGDKAFSHPVTMKSTSGEGKGLYFWDRTNQRKVGNESSDTTLLVFKYLNYIGNRAFMNNPELTGCLLSEVYISLGSRAFVNTKLTDFYFDWNSNNNSTEATATKVASSVIGSSNSFINTQTRGYSHSNWESILTSNGYTGNNATMYTSIYRLIHNTNSGLIALWQPYFSDLYFGSDTFANWKADFYTKSNGSYTNNYTETASQPSLVPELAHGASNNNTTTYTKDGKTTRTSTFLKTKVKWKSGEAGKTAQETVQFGYKNNHTYDFIFVVDNSPSMDRAAKENTDGEYKLDQNTPYSGTNNASKMMNAYSQIYDISEKVLAGNTNNNTNNTVSVISFRGKNDNSLKASSKYITTVAQSNINDNDNNNIATNVPMKTAANVKKALFENNEGYDDNNDGYTNYSSGLSRAYQLINALKNKSGNVNKQVVIFLSDGAPTFYNGSSAVSTIEFNGTTPQEKEIWENASAQVNGADWAAAIRGDTTASNYNSSSQKYSVHSYSSSKYDFSKQTPGVEMTSVNGLNTEIYGILVGTEKTKYINSMADNVTGYIDKVFASQNIANMANSLNSLIQELVTEKYRVVVPFDDNFSMDSKSIKNLVIKKKYTENNELITKNVETLYNDNNNCLYLKGGGYYNSNFKIEYIESLNALIADFQVDEVDKSILPNASVMYPYITYTIDNITLSYSGKGCHYFHTTNGQNKQEYVAVSDNSVETSNIQKSISTSSYPSINAIISSLRMNKTVANGNDGVTNNTVSSGAYVVLEPETKNFYSSNYNGRLANSAAPLWLPVEKGNITFNKYKSAIDSNGKETATTDRIPNAKFNLYDQQYQKVKLTQDSNNSNIYTYDDINGSSNITLTTEALNSIVINDLPYGTYYLYEAEYPSTYVDGKSVDYSVSTLNNGYSKSSFELSDGTRIAQAYKIDINNTNTNRVINVYNKLDVTGKIKGYKYYPSDYDAHGDLRGYMRGGEIGLYPTFEDAKNKNAAKCIDTAPIGYDNCFEFSMANLASNTTYFIAENEAPSGFQCVDIVIPVTTPKDISTDVYIRTANDGTLFWDAPLRKITVNTDGSDAVTDGYDITVSGECDSYSGYHYTNSYTGRTKDGEYVFNVAPFFGETYERYTKNISTASTNFVNGNIDYKTGQDTSAGQSLSGIYRRSAMMSVSNYISSEHKTVDYDLLKVKILDSSKNIQWNVFWYDSSQNFIGCLDNKNLPDGTRRSTSADIEVPSDAQYFRIAVHRGTSLGGIDAVENDFYNGNIIKFTLSELDDIYTHIKYTVKETGYMGGEIPEHILWQEYALNFASYIKAENQLTSVTANWNGVATMNVDSTEDPPTYLSWQVSSYLSNGNPVKPKDDVVSIYNPSLKLTVHNYDAEDKATPLYSSYKTLNGKTLTTDIDLPEYIQKGAIPTWQKGRLNPTDGSEYQNGSYQYRSDYQEVEDATSIKLVIGDGIYNFSIFYYDKDKNFISTNNENKDTTFVSLVPSNAAYYRIVRLNKTSSEGPYNLEVEHIKGGASTFDEWLGSNMFVNEGTEENPNLKLYLEQTFVQPNYQLLRDNFSASYNDRTIEYTNDTGRQYYHIDVTVYNSKPFVFPKVGSDGYAKYIVFGAVLCLAPIIFRLIQRKRRKRFKV